MLRSPCHTAPLASDASGLVRCAVCDLPFAIDAAELRLADLAGLVGLPFDRPQPARALAVGAPVVPFRTPSTSDLEGA